MHAVYAAPSSEHARLAPASDEKSNVAEVWLVVDGGADEIVVAGAAVSTVHECPATGPVLPAGSVARTVNACVPLVRAETTRGEVHDAYAPESSEQAKVAPDSAVNENDADVEFVGLAGVAVKLTAGPVESTVHALVAADASGLPAVSVARTVNVCAPSANDA